MDTLLLLLFVALCLAGCQLMAPRSVVLVAPSRARSNGKTAPLPPLVALDESE